MTRSKIRRLFVALAVAAAGIPLVTSATCDPYYGTLDIYRDDDHDRGILDWFVDDVYYYDDCYYDCYDDYYYEDVIYLP